jgi:hypothetical protein
MDTTGKACVEFWKWAPKKGLVNGNTATAQRVAVTQVLGVLENWEALDVAALDTEDVFSRFVNLKRNNFTPESLVTYKSRFTRGLNTFLDWSRNPAAFKPKAQSPRREKAAATNGSQAASGQPPTSSSIVGDAPPPSTGRTGLVDYPFPLRDGCLAYLKLPVDLTTTEVKRLAAYLNTLAREEEVA